MTSNAIPRKQLFTASCLALLVTSLSFGIRAGILGKLGTEFHLNGIRTGDDCCHGILGISAGGRDRRFYCRYHRYEKTAGNGLYFSPGRNRSDY